MDNREIIIRRAIDLFSAKGYDAVGVQELAEASGVTKPTLYHYFGSKKGLLESLLEEGFSGLIEGLKAAEVEPRDPKKSLTNIADVLFGFATENRDFYRMILSFYFAPPESEPNAAATRYHREVYDTVESLFMASGEAHGNMKGRHREFAASFVGLLNTYIGMYLNGYVEFTDHLVYKIVHQFMHGIFS